MHILKTIYITRFDVAILYFNHFFWQRGRRHLIFNLEASEKDKRVGMKQVIEYDQEISDLNTRIWNN